MSQLDIHMENLYLNIYLTPYTKFNIRLIEHVKSKIIKFLKENVAEYLHDLGVGKVLLNRT